jgi:hypothetical protein
MTRRFGEGSHLIIVTGKQRERKRRVQWNRSQEWPAVPRASYKAEVPVVGDGPSVLPT